ncbi:aryl hydrocarbon receptor 1b [Brienomyrus brachyistius]|uniref:aryl hydrocarbon receptor 1b n=1 Tax=Brienomyrus brachyistius TaxID=42636 RepID=UPI0020B1C81B|nr:aryl hydrocarbon receptor 1b [Brienomyrus brachyistius]
MYAGRKRRKPVSKTVKPQPAEGTKSNPSKRHRDRLNSELERLAGLLPFPEEVTSSLDKLSILRLSVSYLRAKSFFSVTLKNHTPNGVKDNVSKRNIEKPTGLADSRMPEGELLLQALNGFVLVVTSEGIIFYTSHTIQDYLGFHQTDIMHQSVFGLIHTEDQPEFRRNLHWALNPPSVAQQDQSDEDPVTCSPICTYTPDQLPPENSSFLERSFVCRFRCLLDNSSGFLALNLQGRLKFLLGQNQASEGTYHVPPQLALFAIATPLQPLSILEIRTKNMIFRTKHKLDFTPMACDAKGKVVLGYTEAELRVRGSGYQFIHAADMLHCAENHVRMIKTGESGLTVFRLLTKDNRWKWVQANARLVYKNGKPDYIIATQRPLVEEEGGEHLRKRSMHLPFTFTTGEALLYETSCPIPGFTHAFPGRSRSDKANKGRLDGSSQESLDPSSLLGAMMRQDESVYVCQPASQPKLTFHNSLLNELGFGAAGPSDAEASSTWRASPNDTTRPGLEPSNVEPLLSTLDSLTLEGTDDCSNAELFSALENLGLNAEELELLLLDERMIHVDMEPEYIPPLNDLLTNDEILSYVHNSLEGKIGEGGPSKDDQVAISQGIPILGHTPADGPTPSHQTVGYPSNRPQEQAPIIHISQQMQQHLNTQSVLRSVDTRRMQFGPLVSALPAQHIITKPFPAEKKPVCWEQLLIDGSWATQQYQMGGNDHPRGKLIHTEALQTHSSQPHKHHSLQWPQSQIPTQLHSQFQCKQSFDSGGASMNGICNVFGQQTADQGPWPTYSYSGPGSLHSQIELRSTDLYYHNRQVAPCLASHSSTPGLSSVDCNMTPDPSLNQQYHGEMDTAESATCSTTGQVGLTSTGFSQYTAQKSSPVVARAETFPSLESHSFFISAGSPEASEIEKGGLPSSTRLAYAADSLLPDTEATGPTAFSQPCPEVLPSSTRLAYAADSLLPDTAAAGPTDISQPCPEVLHSPPDMLPTGFYV